MSPVAYAPLYRVVSETRDWLAALPKPLQRDVLGRTRRRLLEPGTRLFSRGDPSDGIYRVVEGSVRVSGISRTGHLIVLDFYGPGAWFGEVSALGGGPRGHDAEAYGATTLLHLGQNDVEELISTHATVGRALLRLEAQRLAILLKALESYSTQSMEARLANRLLMLAYAFATADKKGETLKLHLTQETLAQLVGTTRQRVNQILQAWEQERIVTQRYGDVVLNDRRRLEVLAAS